MLNACTGDPLDWGSNTTSTTLELCTSYKAFKTRPYFPLCQLGEIISMLLNCGGAEMRKHL